ncbi:MAG: MFS transporter [Clostridia bacterium]|nr:MFS transporter [Clostridia bacterium]
MKGQSVFQNESVKKAISLGVLCAVSYLAVYIARNVLGAVSAQMEGAFGAAFIGNLGSVYYMFYAIGQLLNGVLGDRIKARNMISLGLLLAGIINAFFVFATEISRPMALVAYGVTGFFLAMIYAPMTKVVSENTEPHHAVRCSLGYTFSSFLGSPIAGVLAAAFAWQTTFFVSSGALIVMAVVCFTVFLMFERRGYVKYGQFEKTVQTEKGGTVKVLLKRSIIKFTLVAALTGVVRTTVVAFFTMYFSGALGYSPEDSSLVYTVATFIISAAAFVAIFMYERMGRRMNLSLFVMFALSTLCLLLTFFVRVPLLNVAFLTLAVMFCNCSSTILWSVYCPSLYDTGRVSSATGFLDFISYMAAAAASSVFGKAVDIGVSWWTLVLVWTALMALGILVALPYDRFGKKKAA